jgi:hypothetical protein
VWEKQRVYRQERSKAMALDKLKRREGTVGRKYSTRFCVSLSFAELGDVEVHKCLAFMTKSASAR